MLPIPGRNCLMNTRALRAASFPAFQPGCPHLDSLLFGENLRHAASRFHSPHSRCCPLRQPPSGLTPLAVRSNRQPEREATSGIFHTLLSPENTGIWPANGRCTEHSSPAPRRHLRLSREIVSARPLDCSYAFTAMQLSPTPRKSSGPAVAEPIAFL